MPSHALHLHRHMRIYRSVMIFSSGMLIDGRAVLRGNEVLLFRVRECTYCASDVFFLRDIHIDFSRHIDHHACSVRHTPTFTPFHYMPQSPPPPILQNDLFYEPYAYFRLEQDSVLLRLEMTCPFLRE